MYRVEIQRVADYARAAARSKIDLGHAISRALWKLGEPHRSWRTETIAEDCYRLTPLSWVESANAYSCGRLCILHILENEPD